jgi:signal transduction histidine kinase
LEWVAHLTRQTLGFYRENSAPGSVQVTELVEGVLELFARKFKHKRIKVQREYGSNERIHAVAGEICQVISNLVANSIDAVREHGTVTIRVSSLVPAGNGNGRRGTGTVFSVFFPESDAGKAFAKRASG